MTDYSSPYKESSLNALQETRGQVKARRSTKIEKGLWSDCSGLGGGHKWAMARTESYARKRDGRKCIELSSAEICIKCNKPKFIVEFEKCKGKGEIK